jgi:long-subunit fatty acid transport protein
VVVALNTRSVTTTRVSDVYLDYGLQYAFKIDSVPGRKLKEDVKIMFGATFTAQSDVSAKVDTFTYSYAFDGLGAELLRDTIKLSNDKKGSITLPLSFGFGFGIKKGERWLATADFEMQDWSSYQAFNQTQGLKNSMRVSVGAQYTPNHGALEGYYKHIQYRAGLRYAQTALVLKSTQLTEFGLSLGAGFPVGTDYRGLNFGMINAGIEIGQRGTTADGLIKENFLKVRIGFTINSKWFSKAKID